MYCDRLIFKRPLLIFFFVGDIAEPGPLNLYIRNGTTKSDLFVGYADDLPVTLAGAAVNTYFLSCLKWVWLKNSNLMCHFFLL